MKQCMLAALLLAVGGTITDAEKPEGRLWYVEDLEPIHDAQVNRLRALGYAELFGGDEIFDQALNYEQLSWGGRWYYPESLHGKLKQAAPAWVDDGNIPMLIVIPENYAPLRWQATRVMIDGVKSDTPQFELSRAEDINDDSTSRYPYLIFNVDMGTSTWRTSGKSVELDLRNNHRRGLTFAEGIALLIQYPDAIKCNRGVGEDYREYFSFGRCIFLSTLYGGACPCDRTAEEFVTFRVRKHEGSGFTRGYFASTIRRDITPNYEHFLFPSCDPYAPEPK